MVLALVPGSLSHVRDSKSSGMERLCGYRVVDLLIFMKFRCGDRQSLSNSVSELLAPTSVRLGGLRTCLFYQLLSRHTQAKKIKMSSSSLGTTWGSNRTSLDRINDIAETPVGDQAEDYQSSILDSRLSFSSSALHGYVHLKGI